MPRDAKHFVSQMEKLASAARALRFRAEVLFEALAVTKECPNYNSGVSVPYRTVEGYRKFQDSFFDLWGNMREEVRSRGYLDLFGPMLDISNVCLAVSGYLELAFLDSNNEKESSELVVREEYRKQLQKFLPLLESMLSELAPRVKRLEKGEDAM